ncbi:MAG TPA: stage II sporulation protein P [Acetivibrio sp.]|nr:stage II sporulation protein P [Clostridium sp.]HOQ36166.1 stage II sporulation protein P [Acetivibrio sp.]HQA58400.1 stage II sporulation protein P [Acetivibrio sp.]
MKRYILKKSRIKIKGVFKVLLIIILSVMAIKLGTIGGDILFRWDKKIIRSIDVENYRSNLKATLPIIDTIYNSGNVSVSLTGYIKDVIQGIFHFDMDSPATILGAQSPYFFSYYIDGYQKQLAQNQGSKPYFYIAEIEGSDIPKDEKKNPEKSAPEPTYPASSISYTVEEDDRKGTPENNPVTYNDIAISNNDTNYKIDIKELMSEPLKLNFDKKGPKVLIYHTHTNEAYLKDISELEKSGVPSRTNDARYNVVRIGEELANIFRKKYGIEVIHNATMHNYPSDTGCYARSLNTATSILKSYPSIKIVLDLHRDGLGGEKKLRVATQINNKSVARIMFVVGTDAAGLEHPNWRENLKLAITLQQKLNEKYPGITRPIYISYNRYNQHLTPGALIVEIGGDGNTIDECLESTKYLAEVISEVINNK